MDLISTIERKLDTLAAHSLMRRLRVAGSPCAPRQLVDGRPMLGFCSNDYLGLAAHPSVVEALREGASLYGAGSGASHLISGHSRAHELLEERLADPDKHWKFDPNDLKERQHWDDYQAAYQQAIHHTDADHAPWYLIPSDSKTHRNLAIASIMLETMKGMKLAYPPAHPEFADIKVV